MAKFIDIAEKRYIELTAKLTIDQKKLLHFTAYYGTEMMRTDFNAYAKFYDLRKDVFKGMIAALSLNGLIYSYDYWNDSKCIHPTVYFPVMIHLLRFDQESCKEFRRIRSVRRDFSLFLESLAKSVMTGEPLSVSQTQGGWPEEEGGLQLQELCCYDEFEQAVLLLGEEDFREVIKNTYVDFLYNDSGEEWQFERLEQLVRKYYSGNLFGMTETAYALLADIGCFRYLFDGTTYTSDSPREYLGTLIYNAIRHLYAGNDETAVSDFTQALKLRNKNAKDKNIFLNPLYCLYLILAYKKLDTEETRTKVQQFLNKKVVNENNGLQYACIAAKYIASEGKRSAINEELSHLKGEYPMTRGLRAILYGYFNYKTDSDGCIDIAPPKFAFLRHELSPYLHISDEERRELTQLYGGEPILASITRKEEWEIMLKKLTDILDADSQNKPISQPQERIGYFIKSHWDVKVHIQTPKKDGTWSAGKPVTKNDFFYGRIGCMDDVDRKIAASATPQYGSSVCVEEALPHLIGTDRVYSGRWAPYDQVTVTEEKPYITLTKSGKGFTVSSNAVKKGDNLNHLQFKKAVVNKIDDTHYAVIPLTDMQKKLLSILMAIERLPQNSAETLRQFLPLLSRHIEVHSELLEGGSSLENKEGNPLVLVQMQPEDDEYLLKVYVRPLDGGMHIYAPGEGDKIIYDQSNGQRFQITRDIRQEKTSLDELTGFLEDLFDSNLFEVNEFLASVEEMLSIVEWIGQRLDRFAIEWPQGKKINVLPQIKAGNASISVKSKENWFDVEGEIKIDEATSLDISAILELIASGALRGNYIKLDEEQYLALSDSLRKQLRRLESLSVRGKDGTHISKFNVGALAELIHSSQMDIHTDKAIDSLADKVREASRLEPAIPANLNAALRDYQYEGFKWMVRLDHWGAGACLADDMGLGKTVQTIAFLLHKAAEGPSLVVAPASVVLNWSKELSRFAPSLNVTVLNHTEDRQATVENAVANDVILTTYGLLPQEEDSLCKVKWNVICLDEAHTIKNRQTKMSASAMKLSAASRVILTGTPIQNYLGELWNLFQFLNPGLLDSFETFSRKFITSDDADLGSLKRMVQPFILRRTKAQVIEELPDKTEIVRSVELSDVEMVAYESMRENARQALDNETKVNVNALAEITRLRQAACAMSLVNDKWNIPSSKVVAFTELVSEIVSGGNRVLVFSQFTSFLSQITAALDQSAIEYHYLDGSTPIKKREKMVLEFQKGLRPVFVVSLKAGGLGLNLTGANYVIHLDPWWNPAIEQQATDRAYRIGQKQNVTVYHLISQHTIEEKILRLHKSKRDLSDSFLEGTDVGRSITLDDLKELVK